MYLAKKWNEIMGPKDERLETEANRATVIGASILLVGSIITLYYMIMLNQVAYTTDCPIMTSLGAHLIGAEIPLMLTVFISGVVVIARQIRSGCFSSHKRFAEVDSIPWVFVSLFAIACGSAIGVLTCGMRIIAEVQIVGVENVAWVGDIAIGIVSFIMGFVIGFVAIALSIHSAIKRRRELDIELES